jgi:hypothetical protein
MKPIQITIEEQEVVVFMRQHNLTMQQVIHALELHYGHEIRSSKAVEEKYARP